MNPLAHRQIVHAALGDGKTLSAEGLRWVVRGNLRSDLDQFSPQRHFDNAPSREKLEEMWQIGLRKYYGKAVELSAQPRKRQPALSAFGQCSHSLADFYAHTNWVEIFAAQGVVDRLAPLTGHSFPIDEFPTGLESGFYSLRYGPSGCPKRAGVYTPPPGFRFCHHSLAKDSPRAGHGAERPGGNLPTYFEIAFQLASMATRDLWNRFAVDVSTQYGEEVCQKLAWGESKETGLR